MHNHDRAVFFGRCMFDAVPCFWLYAELAAQFNWLAADNECEFHAGFFVLMLVEEIFTILHAEKCRACWVFHNTDTVPFVIFSCKLQHNITKERNFCA